jgi:hypothetical protein
MELRAGHLDRQLVGRAVKSRARVRIKICSPHEAKRNEGPLSPHFASLHPGSVRTGQFAPGWIGSVQIRY